MWQKMAEYEVEVSNLDKEEWDEFDYIDMNQNYNRKYKDPSEILDEIPQYQ